MLTSQGFASLVAGGVAIVIGRMFGVIELFVIGAAFFAAVVVGAVLLFLRRPKIRADRWIHPRVLVAGDTGRVDIHVHQQGRRRSSSFELAETVRRSQDAEQVARLQVAPLAAGSTTAAGYHVPTSKRGVIEVGPLVAEAFDPLGVVRHRRGVAGPDTVVVAPRTHLLDMPRLGQGVLGRELLNQARRLGPGEFHSLRDYVEGDEPRSIHWRASARSEDLIVKQHSIEGLRRCTVVLDVAASSYTDADGFERAVTAAASLVHSADRAGLTTRFVAAGGIDLRGPEVGANTLRFLARVEVGEERPLAAERDPGEGLGMVVAVTGTRRSAGWRAAQAMIDPTLTAVCVTTDEPPRGGLVIGARTEDEFLQSWRSLTGRGRIDLIRSGTPSGREPQPA